MGIPPVPTPEELRRQRERRDLAAAADAKTTRILLRWEEILNGLMTSNKRKERASADDSPSAKKTKTVAMASESDDDDGDDDEEEEANRGEGGESDEE